MPEIVFLCVLAICIPGHTQTRRGPSPQPERNVVRAVAVYEWTGDLAKPAAARIIPVSLYLDHRFEEAGLYLSRPVPLALQTGTIYELQHAGAKQGTLTLTTATHLHTADAATTYDDGWFGYGAWKPLEAPKPVAVSTAPSNARVVTSGEGRPHFAKRPEEPAPTTASTTAPSQQPPSQPADAPPADPNRPTLHHTSTGAPQSSGTQTTSTDDPPSGTTPPANPPPAATPSTQNQPSDAPPADPDRPTLHKTAPAKKQRPSDSSASVTETGGLLTDDPNRPRLHHGPGAGAEPQAAPLKGLPAEMHQMAAVSDAAITPEHNFAYQWPDDNAKQAMQTKLENLARAALAPAPTAHTSATRTRKPADAPPTPVELLDEEFYAYEISYGGANVFVFSARTAGEGVALRYVTLLAQPDIYGTPQVLLQSVTDAVRLDQTPRMRFVDAVDAVGDNRAELLFELRGETSRQFALYRIAQGKAQRAFLTGTTE